MKMTIILATAAFMCLPSGLRAEDAAAARPESTGGTDEYVAASTKIDFTDTLIDGKMKAPDGFMLSGRQSQSLTQMVKLRSNFRNELRNSNAVVNTLVK